MRGMGRNPPDESAIPAAPNGGPYDPEPPDEADLWFLPEAPAPGPARASPPLPDAALDPAAWRAAQAAQSDALAGAAAALGALDERLRAGPPGWRHRLALLEAAEMGWWSGRRPGVERLALWTGGRLGATGADARSLAQAGWAARRLTAPPGPDAGFRADSIAAFLGRAGAAGPAPATRDLARVMEAAAGLHPLTRAAIVFRAWRLLGPPAARDVEAAVLAARLGAATVRRSGTSSGASSGAGAPFLPLAQAGGAALRAAGPPERALAAWLRGAERATFAALLHLDRVRDWRARAAAQGAGLSGRTPPVLLDALAEWPVVSVPLARDLTGASRAAVQRNLDRLTACGAIREVTGQGRYRVWAARLP